MTTKTDITQDTLERAELLPCPFCGGSVSFHQDDEECRDGCHYIECKTCGAFDLSTAADPTNTVEDLGELRARIAPLWNRRTAVEADRQKRGEPVNHPEDGLEMVDPASAQPAAIVWHDDDGDQYVEFCGTQKLEPGTELYAGSPPAADALDALAQFNEHASAAKEE